MISRDDLWWFLGMLTAICVAIGGQAELVGEPWRHWIAIAGVVGTAACAYRITPGGPVKSCILLALLLSSVTMRADSLLTAGWTMVRPVPTLTPGVSRALTTATVCGTKWGRDARAVTLAMKKQVFIRYGIPWEDHAAYEVDHLISRELGGADDVGNLWPEPWVLAVNGQEMGAHQKDRAENAAHRAVCAGELRLEDAQAQIAQDWTVLYRRYVGDFPPAGRGTK